MSKMIRVKYERGVLKPLDPIDLKEGEEAEILIYPSELIADKLYGVAKKHRPGLRREDFLEVLKEIENEDLRRH